MRAQKILPSDKIIIFADVREMQSAVALSLLNMDCVVKPKALPVGDYILSDRVGVERKRYDDFIQSIIDKRLFSQLQDLQKDFKKPILLIEGFPEKGLHDHGRSMHPNALRGALASVALDYKIPVLWSDSPEESAQLLFWIARREQVDERRSIAIRGKRSTMSAKDYQEYVVAGLPKIDRKKAQALLNHFGNIEEVFTASEDKLQEVAGIGKKLAKMIRSLIQKEYETKS